MALVAVRPDDDSARAIATHVMGRPWTSRADLVGAQGPRLGSGRSDGEFWEVGRWFVKSRADRRFAASGEAIAAADRLFAQKARLGALTPAHTVLGVVGRAGGAQLFTIAPVLVTLRERLDAAAALGDQRELATALAAFAVGLGETITCSLESGLGLDANPANFAIQGARLRYLDDDVATTTEALGVEDAFVARFTEYAAPEAVWEGYVQRVADELRARTSAPDRARLGLSRRLAAAAGLRRGTGARVERLLALVAP